MKKNKIFQVLGAAALVGLTTMSLTSCKVVDTIKGWFDDDPVTTTETPTTPSTDNNVVVDGSGVSEGTSVPLPKQVIFKKASARTALTVNATVLPENATNKAISWSLAWKTTASETISDYVTITPSSDTFSCAITVKKGFNTPINLTARTKDGTTATCQLDFLKMIETFSFDFIGVDEHGGTSATTRNFTFDAISRDETIKYSETESLDSGMGDYLHFWNPCDASINKYYSETLGYSQELYIVDNYSYTTTGTFGDVWTCDSNDGNLTKISEGMWCDLYLNNELQTILENEGFRQYIKNGGFVDFHAGDSLYGNLFLEFFDTTNMTVDTAQQILEIMRDFEGDQFYLSINFWDKDIMMHKKIIIGFNSNAHTYIPTSSIEFDNANIVVE